MKTFKLEKTQNLDLIILDSFDDSKRAIIGKFQLVFSMITRCASLNEEDIHEAQLNQNVSFAKACAFLETVIDNSIVTDLENSTDALVFFQGYENNVIVLPEVTDTTLLAALYAKLNSITNENTTMEKMSLHSVDDNMTYHYFVDEDDDDDELDYYPELPAIGEWCTELSYWDKPWWLRADGHTFDRVADNKEELERWINVKNSADLDADFQEMLDTIEQSVTKLVNKVAGKEEPVGEVIEVDFNNPEKRPGKWNPTVV